MNLEIKKDLVSNWFKTLQDAFCDDIIKIERNKIKFNSTNWKRNVKNCADKNKMCYNSIRWS